MKNKLFIIIGMVAMLMLVAGCAPGEVVEVEIPSTSVDLSVPGPNPLVDTADENGRISGILLGIWHGIISPVTVVLSFVNPAIQMYEVHNDGSEYNLGFLLGMALVFVFLGAFGARRR